MWKYGSYTLMEAKLPHTHTHTTARLTHPVFGAAKPGQDEAEEDDKEDADEEDG